MFLFFALVLRTADGPGVMHIVRIGWGWFGKWMDGVYTGLADRQDALVDGQSKRITACECKAIHGHELIHLMNYDGHLDVDEFYEQ